MGSHWCPVLKCQGVFLLWDLVLKCFWNSWVYFILAACLLFPWCAHSAASLDFSCSQSILFPEATFLPTGQVLGVQATLRCPHTIPIAMAFGCFLALTRTVAVLQMGLDWCLKPARAMTMVQFSFLLVYCNWCGLQWPKETKPEHTGKGRLASLWRLNCSYSDCPVRCTYLSLRLNSTQFAEETWFTMFMVKISIY